MIAGIGVTQRVNNRAAGRNAHAAIGFADAEIRRSVDGCGVGCGVIGGGQVGNAGIVANGGGVADLAHARRHRINHPHSKGARDGGVANEIANGEGTGCASGRTISTTPTQRTCARVEGRVDGHGFGQHRGQRRPGNCVGDRQAVGDDSAGNHARAAIAFAEGQARA